jgi:hypothetical protein
VAALAGSLALAPGACWWSVSRRPEASVCLFVVIGVVPPVSANLRSSSQMMLRLIYKR